MTFGTWLKAIVPAQPLFDKIAALCVLIENATGQLAWPADGFPIEYWKLGDAIGADTMARWDNEKAYRIDIGSNNFRQRGLFSSTGVVIADLGIDLGSRRDLLWLLETVDRNNQTGNLKGFGKGFNAAYLVRELYKPGTFVKVETAVEATAHIIFTDLRFRQMKKDRFVRHAADLTQEPRLANLVPAATEPFTIGRYLMQMFCLGDDIAEIERRVKFWADAKSRSEKADQKAATEAAERAEFRTVRNFKVAVLHTDNERLARALFTREHAPVFVINRSRATGAVAILSNREYQHPILGNSLIRLTEALQESEPNAGAQWNLNRPIMAVTNGRGQVTGSVATGHTIDKIVSLLGIYAKLETA